MRKGSATGDDDVGGHAREPDHFARAAGAGSTANARRTASATWLSRATSDHTRSAPSTGTSTGQENDCAGTPGGEWRINRILELSIRKTSSARSPYAIRKS